MGYLDREMPGEGLMVIGFLMCVYGMLTRQYWFELGGFLFFFLGVKGLRPIEVEKEEVGGLQEEGDGTENPLGRPPV